VVSLLRLYQRQGAGRPPRVRWALEEAGVSYEYVVMDEDEGRGPEHAERHPLGRVPVLETDEGLLFESAALCLHIADSNPEANLIAPLGTRERAQTYQWVFFTMTELERTMVSWGTARHREDEEAVAAARKRMAKIAAALENGLDGKDYIVGGRFTIADIVLGGVLESARKYKLFPDSPTLLAYLERLDARPAKQVAYS
jgi:glutathione S-transferase